MSTGRGQVSISPIVTLWLITLFAFAALALWHIMKLSGLSPIEMASVVTPGVLVAVWLLLGAPTPYTDGDTQ